MSQLFNVVFTGELEPGRDMEGVIAAFCAAFGVSDAKARKLMDAGRPVTLKKEQAPERAQRYRERLEGLGMRVRLESVVVEPEGIGLALEPMERPEPAAEEKPAALCPKCGSDRLQDDNCLGCGIVISKYLARQQEEIDDDATVVIRRTAPDSVSSANPYAVPQAELEEQVVDGGMTGPHSMPMGHGWRWISRGFWHFRQNPFAWILAIVVWMAISMGATLIPFIGSFAITLISPVIMAGFILGAHEQDMGGDFTVGHVFAGFSNNAGQLLLVGLLYLVGFLLIGVSMALIGAGAVYTLFGGVEGMEAMGPEAMQEMMTSGPMLLALLVGMALSIPMVMAYWFAPSLVAIEGLSAISAMKLSFVGCLKNILPYLFYSLLLVVLIFLGVLPAGLGLLVVLPTITASMYTAYKDIYYD